MANYFDLQVNGYAGIDFNSEGLSDGELSHAFASMAADGVTAVLPTIITEASELMEGRLRRLAQWEWRCH